MLQAAMDKARNDGLQRGQLAFVENRVKENIADKIEKTGNLPKMERQQEAGSSAKPKNDADIER